MGSQAMEFAGDRSSLKKALTLILSSTASKHKATVFLYRGHDGGTVALLEEPGIYLRLPLPGELSGDGALIVSARPLLSGLRTVEGSCVHIALDPASGVLLNGLPLHPALPHAPTPRLPRFPLLGTLHLTLADFRRMLREVVPSIYTDDDQRELSGVLLEWSGTCLRMVTTDGCRLAWSEASASGTITIPPRTLLPRHAARLLHSLLTASLPDPVRLDLSQTDLRIFVGGAILVMPLTSGRFPDYHHIVTPPPAARELTIEPRPLKDALRRLKPITRHNEHLTLHAAPNSLILVASHRGEEGVEAVEAELTGEPLTFGLNRDYLMDVLRVAAGRAVTFSIPDPLSPCLLSLQGRPDCQFVIMPVQLPESIAV